MGRFYLKCKFLLWLDEVQTVKDDGNKQERRGEMYDKLKVNRYDRTKRNGMTGTPKKYRISKHSICKWLLMIVLYCCLSNGIDTQTSAHALLNAHAHRFYLMFAVICSICLAMSTHMSPFHGWSKQQGPFVSRFISLDSWSISTSSESSKMK